MKKWTLSGFSITFFNDFTDESEFMRLISLFLWRFLIFISIGISLVMHIQCNGNERIPHQGLKPVQQVKDEKESQTVTKTDSSTSSLNSKNSRAMQFVKLIAPRDTIILDSLLKKIRNIPLFIDKVDFLSIEFLGKRYNKYGPTGEGSEAKYDKKPLYDLHTFDCVTYIEHVLAIAQSKNISEFLPHLNSIRYKGNKITYGDRNHFFVVDWLVNNTSFFETVHPDSPYIVSRTISKKTFFDKKGIDCTIPDSLITIKAFYPTSFLSLIENEALEDGVYIITFVLKRNRETFASHVGFVSIKDRVISYRCASRITGRVSEENLVQYILKWGTLLEGIFLVKFHDIIS